MRRTAAISASVSDVSVSIGWRGPVPARRTSSARRPNATAHPATALGSISSHPTTTGRQKTARGGARPFRCHRSVDGPWCGPAGRLLRAAQGSTGQAAPRGPGQVRPAAGPAADPGRSSVRRDSSPISRVLALGYSSRACGAAAWTRAPPRRKCPTGKWWEHTHRPGTISSRFPRNRCWCTVHQPPRFRPRSGLWCTNAPRTAGCGTTRRGRLAVTVLPRAAADDRACPVPPDCAGCPLRGSRSRPRRRGGP